MKDYIMAKNNIEENLRGGDNYSQAIDVFVESKINNPKDLQEILIRIERVIPSLGMSQTHRDFRYILEYLKQKIYLELQGYTSDTSDYTFAINPDNIWESNTEEIADYYFSLNTLEQALLVATFYDNEQEMRETILLGYDTYSSVDEIEDITEYYLYLLYFKYYLSEFSLWFESNTQSSLTWSVKLNTNHKFAGKILVFDVELIELQKMSWQTAAPNSISEEGDSVKVHYVLSYEDGTQIESSKIDLWEPLDFVLWDGQMIDWFDFGIRGMKVWEKKTLTLSPEEAYWNYDEDNFEIVPKSELQSFVDAWYKLEVWEKLFTQFGEFTIIEVLD